MKTSQKKHTSKFIIFSLAGIVLVALALYGVWRYKQAQIETQQQAINQSGRAEEVKQDAPTVTENSNTSQQQGLTSEQIPVSTAATVTITSFSQENGVVRASAQVSGEGTCVFQYTTEGDKPVVQEVAVSAKSCSSERPEVEFSKIGTWSLKVTYYTNNERTEAVRDVTIH